MHVFVTGATGLIGRSLCQLLEQSGHQVTSLVRREPSSSSQRQWNPKADHLEPSTLKGCEVLVHLAGESIAAGRWTADRKRTLRESRVNSTALLARALAEMPIRPRAMIVASAIGYYGDRDDEILTEQSSAGSGFLPELCTAWEQAADVAKHAGIRTAHVRTGVVLAKEGGALAQMLLPFKLGLGGVIASGKQYWSWIEHSDIVRLFQFAVENETIHGSINGTAPNPTTNREFTKTLGRVLSRPTALPVPAFAVKLALGEMAEGLLLASARVLPEYAEQSGFQFRFPHLEEALCSLTQ